MSTADIPERWARRIMHRGYVRTRGSGPNLSALAKDIGVHTSTLTNALRGGPRAPDAGTVVKIVSALGQDTAAWFGIERAQPWEPPASAALLTDRQRKALAELIESMTEGGGDRAGSASITTEDTTAGPGDQGERPGPSDIESMLAPGKQPLADGPRSTDRPLAKGRGSRKRERES